MAPVTLTVRPGRPLAGRIPVPGDKSITHRACLFGLLAAGETVVRNPNRGRDCEATLACAAALGAGIEGSGGDIRIRGRDFRLREPEAVLDCGNSGTTLRLLAGALAGQPFLSVLAGDISLHGRPVARIVEPLRRMGATLFARDGDRFPPLVIRGAVLRPIEHPLPVASAQVATCLLLAGLQASGVTAVDLPGPARDHTERLLPAFGVPVSSTQRPGVGQRLAVHGPARLRGTEVRVPGDFSAAAFFLAAAAATPGSRVEACVGLNPTRTGLLDVLAAMGAVVERGEEWFEAGEPVGLVSVRGPDRLEACEVPPAWVPRLIDEIPAWAVAASAARGTSRLTGAAELRVKESDRIAALARNLNALGVAARELADGLEITGGPVRGGAVDAARDHRIAIASAMLGLRAREPVTVADASVIETSFPGFGAVLEAAGGRVERGGGPDA